MRRMSSAGMAMAMLAGQVVLQGGQDTEDAKVMETPPARARKRVSASAEARIQAANARITAAISALAEQRRLKAEREVHHIDAAAAKRERKNLSRLARANRGEMGLVHACG